MRKVTGIPQIILCTLLLSGAQKGLAQDKIDWLSWEEALEMAEHEKRKFVVDVYTDWCGWCKKMDAATFQNPKIVGYINDTYYPIKFNAEQKEEIRLKEKVYHFVRSGGRRGYHELAAKITYGKLSYPTIVFLDENLDIIQPIPGFKDARTFEMIIKYFGENHHKTTPWKQYTINFDHNK